MKLTAFSRKLRAGLCGRLLSGFRALPLGRLHPDDCAALKISFSQFGEDLIIAEHLINLRRARKGIYIDAGCFDPFRYSNTRLLNLLGWRGLNVDASPEAIFAFERSRPGDHNVCAALAERSGEKNEFLESVSGAGSRLANGAIPLPQNARILSRTEVITRTLHEVLENSPLANESVDFLDVDCEGIDFAVLKGFNLEAHRPVLICIEAHSGEEESVLTEYLKSSNYQFLCRRGPSLLFKDRDALPQPESP